MQALATPDFPSFRKLTVADNTLIQNISKHLRPSTILNLTCLVTWNHQPCEISQLNQNLVLRTQGFITQENFFTLLGETDVLESIKIIFKYQKDLQLKQSLHLIPEDMLLLKPEIQELFSVVEEREYSNYVYLLENFKKMSGSKMHTQRKNTTHFLNKYPDLKIEISEFNLKQHEPIITHLFTAWENLKHKSHDSNTHEWEALQRLYTLAEKLSFQIIILKNNAEPLGFCIFELSQQNYIIAHFMKVAVSTPGGEDIIFHSIAEAFLSKGYRFFNTEDDYGIPRLREHKMHLHPEFFIKLYAVYPKNTNDFSS